MSLNVGKAGSKQRGNWLSVYLQRARSRRKGNQSQPVYAPRFDGLTQYALLNQRFIDVDQDMELEFSLIANTAEGSSQGTIISQNLTSTFSDREFQIWLEFFTSRLHINLGGVNRSYDLLNWQPTVLNAINITLSVLSLDSRRVQIKLNGQEVVNRVDRFGLNREPDALTVVCARTNGSPLDHSHYIGATIKGLKINTVTWPMSTRNNPLQPSTPAGNDMTIVNHTNAMWEQL